MLQSLPIELLAAVAILTGFAGLIWSSDRFVAGSASIANSFGISPMVIGLTIVSFGTSAPEVMVAISASLKGAGDLAVGNAIGSNIANIGLVLGITALVARIPVQHHIFKHELPILLGVTLLAGLFLADGTLDTYEGYVLIAVLIPAVAFLVIIKQKTLNPSEAAEEEEIPNLTTSKAIFWFLIGLVALIVSSEILVWGAKSAAELAGVSPLIIGLTVIAVGTSLPELAASVASALKGHHDIALGNILGSNMFNLLAVMSVPAIIHPLALDAAVFYRDYGIMLLVTLLLGLLIGATLWKNRTRAASPEVKPEQANLKTSGNKQAAIFRFAGAVLLTAYIGYYVVLFFTTQQAH
ncbi:calcium/sodium antiporter [Teredinibacter waterburyi]|uniref:calcium/sodium antiporter n=1 Tax=Teredinibacter waterburyi TaxID=1500538 RepID=UPI00165F919B|nr:calcium/sodium antiporter [Teredinibacter waterburyi]